MLFLILFNFVASLRLRGKGYDIPCVSAARLDTWNFMAYFTENSSMVSQELFSSAADVIGALTLSFMNIHTKLHPL